MTMLVVASSIFTANLVVVVDVVAQQSHIQKTVLQNEAFVSSSRENDLVIQFHTRRTHMSWGISTQQHTLFLVYCVMQLDDGNFMWSKRYSYWFFGRGHNNTLVDHKYYIVLLTDVLQFQ